MSERSLSQPEKNYSVEDYLRMERNSSTKHEFIDGRILSSAGSSRQHNLIGTNTTVAVGSRIRGHKCELYVNDMRVQLSPNRFSYPDVIVVSGEPKFADSETDVLLNPTVVVEVISRGSSSYDRTVKLESYLAMDSVREILLIKEDEMRAEHYYKQNPKQWVYRIYNAGDDVITLESVSCKISLSEIYSQVKFDHTEAVKSQAVN
jgi:Uma2 family endonuclease